MQMGRSKFPGKPSKPVNRTRINVLPSGDTEVTLASPADLLEDCHEQVPNLSHSGRLHQNCTPAFSPARRKSCKVQLDRTSVTKRRRIANSTNAKTPARQNTCKRSDKQLSNHTSIKPKIETNNLVGKFVLPSRSAHSSRVIKPNKRFLNVEAVSNVQLRTVKKIPVYKRKNSEKQESDKLLGELQSKTKESQNEDSGKSRIQNSNRRVVLRQARLQFDTQRGKSFEGPFSSNLNGVNLSPPGVVSCGVCGAVRFYRFVNQARKFNINSCESCRKFISKMIKRQRCKKRSILQCLKGQGVCLVPAVVRSQLWKSRCAYKARCNACWLKMCLRSFQMPQILKSSLMEMLPEYMHETNTVFSNSSLFSFHTTNPNLSGSRNLQSVPAAYSIPQRVLRRKVDKDLEKSHTIPTSSEIKRQRLDLKGPRVKHVCRSASIVLGQALAVLTKNFDKPTRETEEVSKPDVSNRDTSENKENDSSTDDNCAKMAHSALENVEDSLELDDLKPVLPTIDECSSGVVPKGDLGKITSQYVQQTNYLPEIISSKKTAEVANQICFDFWENYDPDEICLSGFGLISTNFPMYALCFLCGSAGQDPLLYCCSCCEPYHSFCLEQAPINFNPSDQYYDWVCPRCTNCSACGETSKERVHCKKCYKTYHPECLNVEWQSGTRQMICFTCMCCKSCGSSNTTKFIGNTTLCSYCFKLRNKGNFCPLCNQCYEDDDYNIKMMECGKCNLWIHATCEGLSSEQYQILITLPDSVEFLCCICEPLPYWRKAVDIELRLCFNRVLKLLSKNKKARELLKWNPLHFKASLVKPTIIRKIQFQDNDSAVISDLNFEDNGMEIIKPNNITLEDIGSCSESDESDILRSPKTPSLTNINNKINCKDIISLQEFHLNMEEIIVATKSTELVDIYRSILKDIAPWFDPTDVRNDIAGTTYCDPSQVNNSSTYEMHDFRFKMINNIENDTRTCVLCKGVGDGLSYKEARMIYCGNHEWIHANCALWSSEVYEEIDGSLQNVHSAIARGRSMTCTHCNLKGASIVCCTRTCNEIYHFPCAYSKQLYFMYDKTFYCHTHFQPGVVMRLSSPSEFVLLRTIYVALDHTKKRSIEPKKLQFMVGSVTITQLGVILPTVSDNVDTLVPLNLSCRRLFWSIMEPWKLVPYVITTSMHTTESTTQFIDRNFTLDHSLPMPLLSEKIKEYYAWQREVDLEPEDDEEPQNENSPDILSPELADAILEDLPREFLDRISMQDIFPKMMGNEESLGADILPTELGINESSKKSLAVDEELVFFNNRNFNKISNMQNHQRCSVTLSYKVDSSLTDSSQSRSENKSMYFPLLQVDGTYDNSSSDCDSTIQDVEDLYIPQLSDEPVTCDRCRCTYRTEASYTRHLEICDIISMSDSDTEIILETDQIETLDTNNPETISVSHNLDEPYVNSYETYTAFQATQNDLRSSTVNSQLFLSSDPTVDSPVSQNEIFYSNLQPALEPESDNLFDQGASLTNTFPVTLNHSVNCESSQVTIGRAHTLTFNQQSTNQVLNHQNSLYFSQGNCNHPGTISIIHPSSVPINPTTISLNAATPLQLSQPLEIQQAQQLTLQSVPIQHEMTPIINIAPQNQITFNAGKLLANPLVAQSNPMTQHHRPKMNTVIAQKPIRPRGRPRSLAVRRTGPTIFVPQGNSGTPSVVIHQLPSNSMIPTFLESFQQQTGHNLQYVTSLTPQIAPVVSSPSHMMHFQPESNVVNLLPGMQSAMLLPQTRVLSDQIVVDNNGSLMWSSQPLQTIQSIQPLLYGFETIVQNTVLQSQQFLPGTVPGILTANSSFSSTTQVFQTSKLEPVLDVTSGNYVLVNSNPIITSQPLSMPQNVIDPVPPITTVISDPKPLVSTSYIHANVENVLHSEPVKPVEQASISTNVIEEQHNISENCNSDIIISSSKVSTNTTNSIDSTINIPLASYVPETLTPTIVVTASPASKTTSAPTTPRPMNRVLPMPTKKSKMSNKYVLKNTNEILTTSEKSKSDDEKSLKTFIDDLIKPAFEAVVPETLVTPGKTIPNEEPSLKLVFQKEPDSGSYRITSNSLNIKTPSPAAPEPVKPGKAKNILLNRKLPSVEQNLSEEITPNIQQNTLQNSENMLLYTVETPDGFHYSSTSLSDLWTKVFEAVQAARLAHDMLPLPANSLDMMNGLQLLGLKANGIKYLLEQLPGAKKCRNYKPSYHLKIPQVDDDDDDDSIKVDLTQGTRSIQYSRSHDPSDMFGWLASKHRKRIWEHFHNMDENYRKGGYSTSMPMTMRFKHLKVTSKCSVGVYCSKIHKRGLFCHRDMDSGEMVIEYAGEVIRSILADKREKQYIAKGMGCYMFRIDENFVIDATMKGNSARFINHSCEPNCYSKVVEVLGHKHILIFALRKIQSGEELTYDYKFPFEEDKIPCTCGTRRCRKFLN